MLVWVDPIVRLDLPDAIAEPDGSVGPVWCWEPAELVERWVGLVQDELRWAALWERAAWWECPDEPAEWLEGDSRVSWRLGDDIRVGDSWGDGIPDETKVGDKPAGALGRVAGSRVGDSASCLRNPDDRRNTGAAGDTSRRVDDSRRPRLRPMGRGCSRRRDPIPNPSRPIPRAGYSR